MTLVLRLTLAPLLILAVTLVQRRFGHRVGGRLIGLPLTTGPFLIALCAGFGRDVAARATVGIVAGQAVVIGFCVGYAFAARRLPPATSLICGLALGFASAFPVSALERVWPGDPVGGGLAAGAVAVCFLVLAALAVWPRDKVEAAAPRVAPRWEIPVRMAMAGTLVATLTTATPLLGEQIAGVLSSTPVMLTILMPATHRSIGPAAAAEIARGALISIPVTGVFIVTVGYVLVPLGPVAAFALAVALLLLADVGVRAITAARPT